METSGLPAIGDALTGTWRVGLLIDGNGGPPLRKAILTIDDGHIAEIGVADQFGSRADSTNSLGPDRVLMPGLVDCHAHATLFPDRQPFEVQLQQPDEMLALTAVRQLTTHLHSGVTTVRDCAARGQTMFWVREAIRRGYFAGPRLQLAGRAITHSGGHIWWSGSVADTLDEIRRNVRVLVTEGADVIKLVASGGGTRGGIPYLASYTVEELRVGVETAHALERRTVAHARATQSIENCVDAGIDAIAHVEFLSPGPLLDTGGAGAPTGLPQLDPRVADKLAASSAFLDLNPQSSGWDTVVLLRSRNELTPDEQDQLATLERYFEHFLPVIGALRNLGVVDRMAFGSDAGPFDTEFGHLEYNVHLARQAGLTPMESLQVVTRNAARLCGLQADIGTIEAGKIADLLLLDADPLAHENNLTRVAAVFKSGVRVA
ncbi:MAG: amidohydrolase family protein [Chloroflexi bacterium]|nr:amidohydrolase family protein [Chloroflexota bacterium]MBV9895654.1 amidohydrolase family protein [Chloroflexota bacterium]